MKFRRRNKTVFSRALSFLLIFLLFFGCLPGPASAVEPDSEPEVYPIAEASETSVYALNVTPSGSNNKANFYIYLDDAWTCIGTLDFTVSSSWFSYTPSISTSNILTLINANLGEDYELSSSDFKLRYSNNTNFTNNTGYASIGSTNTTLGSPRNSNTANAAKYIRVMTTNSGNNTHNPLNFYTVTLDYPDKATTTLIVPTGSTVTLPSDYTWTANGKEYSGGASVSITDTITFTGEPIITTCTVTCINGNNTTTTTVNIGDSFTLPELGSAYEWTSGDNTYSAGETVVITGDITFTATLIPVVIETIDVRYNVNFPTGSTGLFNTRFPASPTLIGTAAATTTTDTVTEDNNINIRDVSDRHPSSTYTTHGGGFQVTMYFTGWQAEDGTIIEPNSHLTWEALQSYDANGDKVITLTGQWSYGVNTMANFCIRYDSKTGQSDTSTTRYTPALYSSYMGGTGNISLDGTTDEEAYEVDQQIRALYGNWSGDLWFASFPTDEYIFEALKSHVSNLTVNDKAVNVNDLNSDVYAIRWYMIKKDGGDGWHIDGRLVEKKGQITVDKEFLGNEEAISQAEQDFYIVAVNGTKDASGNFTANSSNSPDFKQHVLVLSNATARALASTYPNASFQVYNASQSDPASHNYEWLIENISLDEPWQISEMVSTPTGYNCYSEYSAYDTDGNTTALAEHGTVAFVTGKTFALDEDPDQGLLVDFRNYYYPIDSIFIKTEDGDTGLAISGAYYELWQQRSDGTSTQMKFSYDSATDQYTYSPNGPISRITVGSAGFTSISTTGFSFDLGDITVKEVIAPSGYAAAPNITLTSNNEIVSITDLSYADGTTVSVTEWPKHTKLEENGSILVVRNYSTGLTSVTVNKIWSDNVTADSVVIVLQANGNIASNAFPGMTGVQATLSESNNWTYTWSNLPTYANGAPVEWGVKEIKIGSEATLTDGVSFANWTVVYSPALKSDPDNDGIPDSWSYTVTNTVRRTQLFITKTSSIGSTPLSGAVFTIVPVEWTGRAWSTVNNAVVHTGTSDSNGIIHFDGLAAGVHYLLTEVTAPSGYTIGQESIVLTIDSNGQINEVVSGKVAAELLSGDYYNYKASYNITAVNVPQYSCTISAPDTLIFAYHSAGKIWNPQTLSYESAGEGTWDDIAETIVITNTSPTNIPMTFEATLMFDSAYLELLDFISMEASKAATITKGANFLSLTGNLSSNETITISITMSGATSISAPSALLVGSLNVYVYLSPLLR